jgi:hypothetical protein
MTSCSVRKAWNASRSVCWRALMIRRFVVTAGRSLFGGSGSVGSNDLTVTESSDSLLVGDMLRGWLLWRCLGLLNLTGGDSAYIECALVWLTSEPRFNHHFGCHFIVVWCGHKIYSGTVLTTAQVCPCQSHTSAVTERGSRCSTAHLRHDDHK